MTNFNEIRRQNFIDEESFRNTIQHFANEEAEYPRRLQSPETHPGTHARLLEFRADDLWRTIQLRYTAGDEPAVLAPLLGEVVARFQAYVDKNNEASDEDYVPPFRMLDSIDTYITYLHLVSVCILLHREDLLPTILSWNEGTDYEGVDAVLEELFKFYIPDRPVLDEWLWDQPYRLLLEAIDAPAPGDRAKLMKKYVKKWYPSMKGQASFWGKHTEITPEFSPYVGYWAMCAAAFTYLYDIDDTSYREEEVYPKDLVDYARSIRRRSLTLKGREVVLRVLGGQPCPQDGQWFSPAKADSLRHFRKGDIMPSFDAAEYGATIWQWSSET
jgi:hypothetical protein